MQSHIAPLRPIGLLLLMALLLGVSPMPAAHAQRGTTTLQGPGFKMEQRNGWFGTQQNVYSDVLGNRVQQKRGWFGRRSNQASILGNQVQRDNRGTTITDNQGNVVVKRRRGWFGREDTTINTDSLFQQLKGVSHRAQPPQNPNPGY
jgi:hypothetical protein